MDSVSSIMMLLCQRCLFLIILACVICQRPCAEVADIPSTIFSFPPVAPNSTEKFVALTFDDGPHTTLTPKLLDSLQKLNAKVTFFVMGVKLASRAAVLQRAVLEGHEIANHAWNHPVMTKIPFEEVKYQLELTSEAIYNATGKKPGYEAAIWKYQSEVESAHLRCDKTAINYLVSGYN